MKKAVIASVLILFLFNILLFVGIFAGDSDEEQISSIDGTPDYLAGMNLSEDVLAYQSIVESYADEYGISEYVGYLMSIMQVESGGRGDDVMQSSEYAGVEKDSLHPEESIRYGCKFFSELLNKTQSKGCDINTAIQAYNFGSVYVDYVAEHELKHTFTLAEAFAEEKSGGITVKYNNAIAISTNGGWRYKYGNMFYVQLVSQYLFLDQLPDETYDLVMNEALKYEGWRYVFGGASPSTSFDCSGLTQYCFGQAGIELGRTAQDQYNGCQHIPVSEAKPGDLIFFQGTYSSGTYITHVGIYVGENKMFDAGDPIGYSDLTTDFWQEHIVCAGRIRN